MNVISNFFSSLSICMTEITCNLVCFNLIQSCYLGWIVNFSVTYFKSNLFLVFPLTVEHENPGIRPEVTK